MPTSGGGTGTPITGGVPGSGFPSTYRKPRTYLTLEEYARRLGIAESALYGIRRDGNPDLGCGDQPFNETTRFQLADAFRQAEASLAVYLHHPLLPTYICDEAYEWDGCAFDLRLKNIIATGKKVEEIVSLAVPTGVSTLAEEYDIEVPVDFSDCREIVVYYPDQTKFEINPSEVTISGTTATISIPRARLLKPEYLKDYNEVTADDRPRWEDSDYFLPTVDVYRRFTDRAQGVTFVWRRKSCGCGAPICLHTTTNPGDVVTQTGVAIIENSRLGSIRVEPATFDTDTGEWTSQEFTERRAPDGILMSYVAGINPNCDGSCPPEIDPELPRAIIGLAHGNLPLGICDCAPAKIYYQDDAFAPTPNDGPTIWTPFGRKYGQNLAWQIVQRTGVGVGGLLA